MSPVCTPKTTTPKSFLETVLLPVFREQLPQRSGGKEVAALLKPDDDGLWGIIGIYRDEFILDVTAIRRIEDRFSPHIIRASANPTLLGVGERMVALREAIGAAIADHPFPVQSRREFPPADKTIPAPTDNRTLDALFSRIRVR